MEPKPIIHLFGESYCAWTLIKKDFTTFQEKEFVTSPLYCAKEFANLEWVFLLEKSGKSSYDCILRTKKCIDENPSRQLTFTIHIVGEENLSNIVFVNAITTCKLRKKFFLNNARNCNQIIIFCKVTCDRDVMDCDKKPVEFFNNELFFLNEKFSDFVFIVGENRYPAHKMILAANSPVFTAMFSCEMKENCLNQVEIEDFEPELIQEFLCFLYKGKISNWEKFGRRLFAVAHKYEVESLKSKCTLFLENNLNVKNVIDLLIFSEQYSIENLKKNCISLINKEFKRIEEQENYQNLRKTHPDLLTDIFNSATRKVEEPKEPRSDQHSSFKYEIMKSGVWTINSINIVEILRFPFVEIKEFFWTFIILRRKNGKIYLCLGKRNKPGFHITNDSLKFKVIVQSAKRAIVEVKIEDTLNGYKIISLDESAPNLTIFWEIESISKADEIQESKDMRHSPSYELFFMNPYLSDINFHSEGKQFPSHKLLLCSKSAGFRKIFLSERESQEKILNLQVDEIKPKVLEGLFKFIYKGIVENLNDIATDLYVVAQKYEIHDLKLVCEKALLKKLDSKNVISTLIFSDKYNMECLKDECIFLIIKESIRFEKNLESSENVDPKVIMEIIHAIHTGKRPLMIRNVNRDVTYFINRTLKDSLYIYGPEILSEILIAHFALDKCERIIDKMLKSSLTSCLAGFTAGCLFGVYKRVFLRN